MNIILIPQKQEELIIPKSNPRYKHIQKVLRMQEGDTLDIGAVNGPRGKATLVCLNNEELKLQIAWGETPPQLSGVEVIIGIPRPQTARKILNTLTTLGISAFHFFHSDKGEPSYAKSKLWQTDEWKRHLHEGAEQSFSTHIPKVQQYKSLEEALSHIPIPCIGLDNYEATGPLTGWRAEASKRAGIIIGSERGFSAEERDVMRDRKTPILHLGERVLRAETAATVACGILLEKTGYWDS